MIWNSNDTLNDMEFQITHLLYGIWSIPKYKNKRKQMQEYMLLFFPKYRNEKMKITIWRILLKVTYTQKASDTLQECSNMSSD